MALAHSQATHSNSVPGRPFPLPQFPLPCPLHPSHLRCFPPLGGLAATTPRTTFAPTSEQLPGGMHGAPTPLGQEPQTCVLKAKRSMGNSRLYSLPHHFPGLPWVRPIGTHQVRRGETLSWLKSPLPSKLGIWLLYSLGLRVQNPTEATSRKAVGKPPSFCEPQFPHLCSTVSLQSSKDRALFSMSSCCSFAKLCLTLYDPMDPKQHARLPCPSLSPRVWANLYPLSQ